MTDHLTDPAFAALLDSVAEDAPNAVQLRDDVRQRYRRQLIRRRYLTAGSVAAAVLVIAGTVAILTPSHPASGGPAAGPGARRPVDALERVCCPHRDLADGRHVDEQTGRSHRRYAVDPTDGPDNADHDRHGLAAPTGRQRGRCRRDHRRSEERQGD